MIVPGDSSAIGSTGIVSDNFLRVAGKDGDGVYSDMDLNVTHPDAPQRTFLTAYRNAYHARANNFASFAWDAAHLAALPRVSVNGLWQDLRHLEVLLSGAAFALWNRGRRLNVA